MNSTSTKTGPKRVVVLGAGGFIGRHLVADLEGAHVPVLAVGSADIDLTQPAASEHLAERLAPGDALIFLSALTPDKGRDAATLMRNLAMAQAVISAARKVAPEHIVYLSSDAVYAPAPSLINEATPAVPTDLYGAMHRTRELMLTSELPQTPVALLRITGVYGPGDTHNSYGPNRFIRNAVRGEDIALFGGGEEMRDHIFVGDVVKVIRAAVTGGFRGVLNVATGTSVSFMDAARAVAECAGGTKIAPSPRKSPVTHRHFDTLNISRAFPELRFTGLRDGLQMSLAASPREPAAAR